MAKNQAHVLYVPGCDITCDAKAAVKGGTFVAPSGDIAVTHPVVSTATADTTPLGVAAYDAEKDTQVLVIRGNAVVEVTAGGVFAAGDAISVGANGKAVKTGSGPIVGVALNAGKADSPAFLALR